MSEKKSIQKEDLIGKIPLFAGLPRVELERLAKTLQACEFPEQAILFQEGETDEACFLILEGQVEIIKSMGDANERNLGVRSEGTLLGEMSLFSLGGTHTASVRAHTALKALKMTHLDFDALLNRWPSLAYQIVSSLSRRLEESENLTIIDLEEKNRQLTLAYQELKAAQAQIIEKEKLERELEIARRIQQNILPHRLPEHPDFDFGALMIPARAVGGDLYQFIPLNRNRLGVVVGDVSDKGVPSALFMSLVYSLMRAEAGRGGAPAQVLRKVNHYLLEINVEEMYVTLLYGILDISNGNFAYVRAGHPPPYILDDQGDQILLPTGLGQPLGLFDHPVLDEQNLNLPPGGLLLIYSDGLSEASDSQGREFGATRLQGILSISIQKTSQEICDQLWNEVKLYTAELAQQDDFTVVSIRRARA
jgi:sigma-B regulation protein RsbU (phosphoserine phosphatase)